MAAKTRPGKADSGCPLLRSGRARSRLPLLITRPYLASIFFPTLLALLDLPLPPDRLIDGQDISGLLLGTGPLPERPLFYYSQTGTALDAVRDGRFKYHRRRGVRASGMGDSIDTLLEKGPWLFDLSRDAQESYDVSERYPEDMQRLQAIFEARNAEMKANIRGWLTAQ